jgi:hypothetical protein
MFVNVILVLSKELEAYVHHCVKIVNMDDAQRLEFVSAWKDIQKLMEPVHQFVDKDVIMVLALRQTDAIATQAGN